MKFPHISEEQTMNIDYHALKPITLQYNDYSRIGDAIWYIEQVIEDIKDIPPMLGEYEQVIRSSGEDLGSDLAQALGVLYHLLEKAMPPEPENPVETDSDDVPF